MEKLDNSKVPAWMSIYGPSKHKGQSRPGTAAESGNRSRLHSGVGREPRAGAQSAASVGKGAETVHESSNRPSTSPYSVGINGPGSFRQTHATSSRGTSAGRPKQQHRKATSQASPRRSSDTSGARAQVQAKQRSAQEQQPAEQSTQSTPADAVHEQTLSPASPRDGAGLDSEIAAANKRVTCSPQQQQSRQLGNQLLSPYLAPLPKSVRRPRSPGPRPRSPLSGLSRLSAQGKTTSTSGQAHPSPTNSTSLATNIYSRQHLGSRLGPRSAAGRKRPHFHHQQPYTFQIEVSYGPGQPSSPAVAAQEAGSGGAEESPAQVSGSSDEDRRSVEQQLSHRAAVPAGHAQGTVEPWNPEVPAAETAEPELGMTLSEYIAQMHTTPVACNSVSGLGDESDDEYSGHAHWPAATSTGGSILAAWGMSGPATGSAVAPHAIQDGPAVGVRPSEAVIAHQNQGQQAEGVCVAAGTDSDSTQPQQQLRSNRSSSSSLEEAAQADFDALQDSEGPSDIECYPDLDSSSSSDLEESYQVADSSSVPVVSGKDRQSSMQTRTDLTLGAGSTSTGLQGATLRPASSAGRRDSGTLLPTKSLPTDKRPSGFPMALANGLDFRPATASNVSMRSRTAADLGLTDANSSPLSATMGLRGPSVQQRSFTDLDSSSEGFVKEVSLGHLSAALFTPSPAAVADAGAGRASWQQLWGSSSMSEGSSTDRSSTSTPYAEPSSGSQPPSTDSSRAGNSSSTQIGHLPLEQQHRQLLAGMASVNRQSAALSPTMVQQQAIPRLLQTMSSSSRQAGTGMGNSSWLQSSPAAGAANSPPVCQIELGAVRRSSVPAVSQHPVAVMAWGAPSMASTTAAAGQTAMALTSGQTAADLVCTSRDGYDRLFSTFSRDTKFMDVTQEQVPQPMMRRPPGRQKPPAQSLHLITAFGPAQTGGLTSASNSQSGAGEVAVGDQAPSRPDSAGLSGTRRPASARH